MSESNRGGRLPIAHLALLVFLSMAIAALIGVAVYR